MKDNKKIYILDTNIYLTDAMAIRAFEDNDIIIPLKVLEEIDKHKRKPDSVGSNARRITRILDDLRNIGSLQQGVSLGEQKGNVSVSRCFPELIPEGLDKNDPDNLILSVAIHFQNSQEKEVVFITHDINLRIRCDSLNIKSEPFLEDKVVDDVKHIYSGFSKVLVDEQIIDEFYANEKVMPEQSWGEILPHEFIMLTSSANNKKTALARFISHKKPLEKVDLYAKGILAGKVKPKNKEQQFALNLLMDKEIPIVTLIGPAGTGKSLITLAAALEQSYGEQMFSSGSKGGFELLDNDPVDTSKKKKKAEKDKPIYEKVLVMRSVIPVGKDIGFLPGSISEKIQPWLAPITDNLEYLLKERKTIEEYQEAGILEIEAMTYIRGRSIANAFIIIEECQNMTVHEMKTVLTRIGDGSKIILVGDVEQIDNPYLDATNNGLSYVIEKMKQYDLHGHMTLTKGERSKAATLAAKVL